MTSLHLLSGGAAQGLVRQLQASFEANSSLKLDATFGAVGAMKQRLMDGAPCDLLILTQALIDGLVQSGQVRAGSDRKLGIVKTGIAVKAGTPWPAVDTADHLRQALRKATGIYFPDPQLATAGIHFMKVLNELGIANEVAERLRPFPNGATAMKAMAACDDPQVIGCTQVTEILITDGIDLVADLPPVFELATVYTAAVCTASAHPQAATQFIEQLVSPAHVGLRQQGGFLPAA
jgi:molybdate transport system substrate-binding protein